LQDLKKLYDLYITGTREVKPPAGFALEDWTFYEITRTITPTTRYSFSGKLYVLIDGGTASAADDYADLVKRLNLGTLVGQNTGGGGGALLAPGVMRLPRSGMVFRTETEICLSPDGYVDELFGTAPDLRLPPAARPASITREDLLKDEWIKHILAAAQK
jgi:C-terminal processing protease CtpA/Prc